jgi:integrase/recombinase XerD
MSDFEHVETWLNWKLMNQGKSELTITKYRRYLQTLEEYLRDDQSVELLQADSEMLVNFTGLYMHQKGLSPRSRRALVAAVKGFYQWALKQRLIPIDVTGDLEYPNAGRKLPDVATLKTAEALIMAPDIDTLKGIRDCTIMAVLTGLALRVSGLCNLNESNLIWTEIDGKQRLIIKVTEKGKRERMLPAPNDVWLLIRAYLGHPDLAAIDRSLPSGDQVLFVSLNNRMISQDKYHGEARRISPRSIDDMIKGYGRKLKLPEKQLHSHALRHLFGAEMAEDDVSLRTVQELLGHESPKTTAIYTQLAMRRLTRTVDQSNPLGKIHTPVRGLEKILEN